MYRAYARRLVATALTLLVAGPWSSLAKADEPPPWTRWADGRKLSEQGRARIASDSAAAKRAGFIDRPAASSPIEVVLKEARDDEAKTQAMVAGRTQPVRRRYLVLNDALEKRSPMRIAAIPSTIIRGDSHNFIAMSKGRVVRVYSDTALGALMVREIAGGTLHTVGDRKPDLSLSGTPVFLSTVKYAGSRWVTEAVASNSGRIVHVFFGAKVDTDEERALVQSVLNALLAS